MYTDKDEERDTINQNRKATIHNLGVRIRANKRDLEDLCKKNWYNSTDGYTDWNVQDVAGIDHILFQISNICDELKDCYTKVFDIEKSKEYEQH